MFKIELNSTVKSSVTGLKGIAVSRSEHMNGCNRYLVQPKVNDKGDVPDAWWIDEMELKVLKKPPAKAKVKARSTGGPMSKFK